MLCTEDIRAAEGCNHNLIRDEDVGGGCLDARWRDLEVSFVWRYTNPYGRLDVHIDPTRLQLRKSRPERKPRLGARKLGLPCFLWPVICGARGLTPVAKITREHHRSCHSSPHVTSRERARRQCLNQKFRGKALSTHLRRTLQTPHSPRPPHQHSSPSSPPSCSQHGA